MALTEIDGTALAASAQRLLGNRYMIVKGSCQVAQRSTSVASVTSSGYHAVDRFKASISNLGTWTISQPAAALAGFNKSFKVFCTTADGSPAAGDYAFITYAVEAQDLRKLAYGDSSAKATTLSFYVKSNKTGNASIELQQQDNSDKQVSFQYNIASADTWERKIIRIPGDTAGVINDDTGSGIRIGWWLNSGSTYTGGSHRSTWTAEANADRNVSNIGIGGATSDYIQITGVQWEVGESATEFEHRTYADDLLACQRYYQQISGTSDTAIFGYGRSSGTTSAIVGIPLTTPLRASPDLTCATVAVWSGSTSDTSTDAPSVTRWTASGTVLSIQWSSGISGLTNARSLVATCSSSSTLEMDSEL